MTERTVRTAEQVSVGDQLPSRTLEVDRARLVQYAGASLDRNPIHWDDRFAKQVGLPDVIAHGMWTMGAAIQLVVDWVGDAGRVVDYGVRFSGMVVVPHGETATVEVGGTVKSVSTDAETGDDTAVVELTVTHGGAKVLTKALATVRLG